MSTVLPKIIDLCIQGNLDNLVEYISTYPKIYTCFRDECLHTSIQYRQYHIEHYLRTGCSEFNSDIFFDKLVKNCNEESFDISEFIVDLSRYKSEHALLRVFKLRKEKIKYFYVPKQVFVNILKYNQYKFFTYLLENIEDFEKNSNLDKYFANSALLLETPDLWNLTIALKPELLSANNLISTKCLANIIRSSSDTNLTSFYTLLIKFPELLSANIYDNVSAALQTNNQFIFGILLHEIKMKCYDTSDVLRAIATYGTAEYYQKYTRLFGSSNESELAYSAIKYRNHKLLNVLQNIFPKLLNFDKLTDVEWSDCHYETIKTIIKSQNIVPTRIINAENVARSHSTRLLELFIKYNPVTENELDMAANMTIDDQCLTELKNKNDSSLLAIFIRKLLEHRNYDPVFKIFELYETIISDIIQKYINIDMFSHDLMACKVLCINYKKFSIPTSGFSNELLEFVKSIYPSLFKIYETKEKANLSLEKINCKCGLAANCILPCLHASCFECLGTGMATTCSICNRPTKICYVPPMLKGSSQHI